MHGKKARRYQRKGAIEQMVSSRLKHYLSKTTPRPEFGNTAAIEAWASTTAHQVLVGVLDPRAASEARQLAALTISARAADVQAATLAALERLEGGGQAFVLLEQLRAGLATGERRPLPPRRIAPPSNGDAS